MATERPVARSVEPEERAAGVPSSRMFAGHSTAATTDARRAVLREGGK